MTRCGLPAVYTQACRVCARPEFYETYLPKARLEFQIGSGASSSTTARRQAHIATTRHARDRLHDQDRSPDIPWWRCSGLRGSCNAFLVRNDAPNSRGPGSDQVLHGKTVAVPNGAAPTFRAVVVRKSNSAQGRPEPELESSPPTSARPLDAAVWSRDLAAVSESRGPRPTARLQVTTLSARIAPTSSGAPYIVKACCSDSTPALHRGSEELGRVIKMARIIPGFSSGCCDLALWPASRRGGRREVRNLHYTFTPGDGAISARGVPHSSEHNVDGRPSHERMYREILKARCPPGADRDLEVAAGFAAPK